MHAPPSNTLLFHAPGSITGAFRDKLRDDEEQRQSMAEQIALREAPGDQSHTAGFEAWLRSRGESAGQVRTPCEVPQFVPLSPSTRQHVCRRCSQTERLPAHCLCRRCNGRDSESEASAEVAFRVVSGGWS
jgi:hypothetical protein